MSSSQTFLKNLSSVSTKTERKYREAINYTDEKATATRTDIIAKNGRQTSARPTIKRTQIEVKHDPSSKSSTMNAEKETKRCEKPNLVPLTAKVFATYLVLNQA